jgi:molybdopterin converting factor subunit 1
LEIKLFATLKERAKANVIAVPIETATTVRQLRETVAAHYPVLAPLMQQTLVAVNQEFAFNDDAVQPNDEVALFPPVSGG